MNDIDACLMEIRILYFKIMKRAFQWGMPTNNVKIFMRPELASALDIGETLLMRYYGKVKVVRKDDIPRKDHSTDVYIYDPNWNWKEEIR